MTDLLTIAPGDLDALAGDIADEPCITKQIQARAGSLLAKATDNLARDMLDSGRLPGNGWRIGQRIDSRIENGRHMIVLSVFPIPPKDEATC